MFNPLVYYYCLGSRYGATPVNSMEWAINFCNWWKIPDKIRKQAPQLKGVD